jgi:hypothetical protein
MANDPYCRLYWRLSDEYPAMFDEPVQLGTYVRLLMYADMAWPSRPHLPADLDAGAVGALEAAGLVTVEGKRYAIRGLDKERRHRRKAARKGAAVRWHSGGSDDAAALAARVADANAYANASPNGMPSRAEPSRAEPTRAHARVVRARGAGKPEQIGKTLGGKDDS